MERNREETVRSAERIEGTLVHVVFRNEENGFTVARLKMEDRPGQVTVAGVLVGVAEGESLRCFGSWTVHPRFGEQFQVERFEVLPPSTRKGLVRYLSGTAVKHIGPKIAERMVDHFGEDVLRVLDEEPKRLLEVPGIGKGRLKKIREAWAVEKGLREVMVFLQGHGLGPGHALRVYRRYGAETMRLVRENPYRLSEEIWGIGFKTADRIALSLGVDKDAPFRVRAALLHLLAQAVQEGHLCLPRRELLARAAAFLDTDLFRVEAALDELRREGRIVLEATDAPPAPEDPEPSVMVFLESLHEAEAGVCRFLLRLQAHAKWSVPMDVPRAVAWAEERAGIVLEERQREAVEAALREPVLVITGGPGVGKTTIVRCIAAILAAKKFRLALAAPTGRAAKRLAEATGLRASTIHRLLRFNPKSFTFDHDEDNPLPHDVLIVDESSMIDVPLMESLVRALRPQARLVLVGDADQLPSVGPGALLHDLIACDRFPVVRLTRLFRQAEGGGIVRAAHRVNAGRMPEFGSAGTEGEIFFVEEQDPKQVAEQVVRLVGERIPTRFRLDPVRDVQVLTPMHKGAAGTENLNRLLQAALNPEGESLVRGGRVLRVGDKVMQVQNNYELGVFNGDIGYIRAIDRERETLSVEMDDRHVIYGFEDLDDLMHAYSVSVHKSQGSEFPAVVMVLLTQHFILLRRKLLYTGITRAKRLLVVVGTERALRIAVRDDRADVRYSLLEARLRRGCRAAGA